MISSPGKVMICQPVVDRPDDEDSMMRMEDMDDGGKDKGRGSYKCGKVSFSDFVCISYYIITS